MHPQLQRCYDLAIKGAWNHPFFLVPLGHCEWHEGTPGVTKTAEVSVKVVDGKPEIHLWINTQWVAGIPDEAIFGLLGHEILHPMLRHHERGGGKKREWWGQAADMAINSHLRQAGIALPAGALFPPAGHEEASADELYVLLESGETPSPPNYDPGAATRGCMPDGKDGTEPGSQKGEQGEGGDPGQGPGSGEGEDPSQGQGEGQGQGNDDRAWGEMIAQAQSYSRGTGAAKVLAKMFAPKPTKTGWKRLIRNTANKSQAKGGRDVQTFTRINRRSGNSDFILPGWQSSSPSLAILIDSSGSVSDAMLEAAINNVKEVSKLTNVRMFIALHACSCYYSGWITPDMSVSQLSKLCTDRGGTDPREAFEAVGKARGRFDAAVYLTDGEVGTYPQKPTNVKRMIVGVIGDGKYRTPIPESWQEVSVQIDGAG